MYRPRDYWTWRALVYGPDYVGPGSNAEKSEVQTTDFTRMIDKALKSTDCRFTLDFGCGSGRFAPAITNHAKHYLGVDISQVGIDQARWDHPDLHFMWLAEDRIPLPDDTVSLVAAIIVFQHIVADEDWKLWTAEIRRVLREDGAVLVIDDLRADAEHMKHRTPEEVGEMLGLGHRTINGLENHWTAVFR